AYRPDGPVPVPVPAPPLHGARRPARSRRRRGLRRWTRPRLRRRWLGMSSRGRAVRVLRRASLRLFSGAGFASPWGFVSRLGISGWAAGGPGVLPGVRPRLGWGSAAVGLAVGVLAGLELVGAAGPGVGGALDVVSQFRCPVCGGVWVCPRRSVGGGVWGGVGGVFP